MREAALITGHGDLPMTVQAMKAGAVEFLKNCIELRSCRRWEPNL
jgi:FixJ family two-component response regulator